MAFFSLHTRVLSLVPNPCASCMYTSSWKSPFKNALLTFICWISHLKASASEMITLMVVGLTICENVSWKSNLSCWWNPLATSMALYLLIELLAFSLNLYIHLQLMACLCGGRVVRTQLSFFSSEFNSVYISMSHSGLANACLIVVGSEFARNTLSLEWLVLAIVSM